MANTADKVLLIGLDGYDCDYAQQMMARGELPAIATLQAQSTNYRLDHGSAKRSGLAFEHFSSGLSPQAGNRWSAVHFDQQRYQAWQEDVRFEPFTRYLAGNTVVFDVPYFKLQQDPKVRGIVSWGAHDPGTPLAGQPSSLLDETLSRFGAYPAPQWIYGFAWPSAEKCKAMGAGLCESVERRSDIVNWLFGEKLPDWDLGITVVSELHSASEGLWHGADPQHPLHSHPSATEAGTGLANVYKAVDRFIGGVKESFPGVTLVLFSMHGMGSNESDVASMALLPELMLRKFHGASMLKPKPRWIQSADGIPMLAEDERWRVPLSYANSSQQFTQAAVEFAKAVVRKIPKSHSMALPSFAATPRLSWMPAIHYQPYWQHMQAFALPSFYDGRIRINLQGREGQGMVPLADYSRFRDELGEWLRGCTNIQTGRSAIRGIEFSNNAKPLTLEASDADITVDWDGAALALEHPDVGLIGPLPYRRPGGHTGGLGMACIHGPQVSAVKNATRSAFDVVPTVFDLRGEPYPDHLSGRSLLQDQAI